MFDSENTPCPCPFAVIFLLVTQPLIKIYFKKSGSNIGVFPSYSYSMKRAILFFALIFCVCAARGADKQAPQKPLIVHEWGTFTSLQDEQGNAIAGINTDDEPVPDFVHRLAHEFLIGPTQAPPNFFQGAPACHPDVTMRLETPVIYFYPPEGWKPALLDVHVAFRNGWLTEFYPNAGFKAPGFDASRPDEVYTANSPEMTDFRGGFGRIKEGTEGELTWGKLSLEGAGACPQTEEKVWLAPRAVASTAVKNLDGESEKFLFYRGVAHNDAPLRIVRNKGQLEIHNNIHQPAILKAKEILRIDAAWLVDVQADGSCAFKSLGAVEFGGEVGATMPATFDKAAYAPKNMEALRDEMRVALVKKGLFADEADALLNTWRISYFQSPGLRLFYLCPRVEIDGLLPLEISARSDVTRVMVGRIEVVTPEQRALLAKIAAGPAPAVESIPGFPYTYMNTHPESGNSQIYQEVMDGKKPLIALGIPIPEIYADFLKLGRFREALLLDEEKRRPTAALKDFIEKNGFMDEDFFAQLFHPAKS
jgi:hypothetical protein